PRERKRWFSCFARRFVQCFLKNIVEALRRYPPMHFSVEHERRRAGTVAQAIYRFKRECPVGCRVVKINSKAGLGVFGQCGASRGLARFRLADSENVATRGFRTKVMIESHHAMHFRT